MGGEKVRSPYMAIFGKIYVWIGITKKVFTVSIKRIYTHIEHLFMIMNFVFIFHYYVFLTPF